MSALNNEKAYNDLDFGIKEDMKLPQYYCFLTAEQRRFIMESVRAAKRVSQRTKNER